MSEERKLTRAEEERLSDFEKVEEEYQSRGYARTVLTVDIRKANLLSFAILAAAAVVYGGIFFLVRGAEPFLSGGRIISFMVIIAVLVLTVVHEMIHGLTWIIVSGGSPRDISFGVDVKHASPYCSCRVPMKRSAYITGALMPLVVLGIIPFIPSVILGSVPLLTIAVIMTSAATGDIMIVKKISGYKSTANELLVIDHPVLPGAVVFEK